MGTFIKEGNGMTFNEAIDQLMENIKKDYSKWTDWAEGIERFNKGVGIKRGRKYTKVMIGNSVWGFIANGDGVLKGIPYNRGDVFKAASWRGPAKHVRGNIFTTEQKYFQWTGPKYRY